MNRFICFRRILSVVILYCLATALFGLGQISAAEPETPPALEGYLAKPPPLGLRFAPAPKPRVLTLPALPLSEELQPVLTTEYAAKLTELKPEVLTATPASTNQQAKSLEVHEIASEIIHQKPVPPSRPEQGAVNNQMLLKFFQAPTLSSMDPTLKGPLTFQPPLQKPVNSSASYEIK